MTVRLPAVLALSAALLSGCAHVPRVDVAEVAERPVLQSEPTYGLAVQAERLPTEAGGADVLRQALARHGWREAGGPTAWTVRAAYAVRPEHVGAQGADEEIWLVQPRRTPWWRRSRAVHTLTLSLVQPGAQRESYRVSASISGPVTGPAETLQALTDAAAERLDPRRPQSPDAVSSTRGRTTTKQAPSPPPS